MKDKEAQFWALVDKAPVDKPTYLNKGCWLWKGLLKRRFHKTAPYRYVYKIRYGSPRQGFELLRNYATVS
jgi:hypothetical protein